MKDAELVEGLPEAIGGRVASARLSGGVAAVVLDVSGLDERARGEIEQAVKDIVGGRAGVAEVRVAMTAEKRARRILAVGSGKGGVGKSTLAANLAIALKRQGMKVGLVARGGYHWSRFAAFDHGPRSDVARQAALLERELCQAADVVVGTSPAMAGDLAWGHGLDPDRTVLIPNYIMPDIPKCGGLSECRKIANLAELYYMPFAPHTVSSNTGTLASAHVCATVPNFMVLEFHWLHRDYWTTIIQEKEDIIKDGYIWLNDRPGIGVELDEEVGRQYQYPGTTWF